MLHNRPLLSLFFAQLVVSTGFGVIVPVLPYLALSLGATSLEVGTIMSVYSVTLFISSPIWGWLSDRVGRKPVLIFGVVGLSIGFFATAMANTLWMLIAIRAVSGLLAGAVNPTSLAFVGDVSPLEDRGKSMGLISSGMGIGFIIGPALGGALVPLGLGMPFIASGVLSLFASLVCVAFLPNVATTIQHAIRVPRLILPRGSLSSPLALAVLLSLVVSLAESNRQSTIALYGKDVFGLGGADMGFVFTVMGITYVILQGGVVGPLIDKLGERRMLLVGLPLSAIGFIMVLFSWDLFSLTAAVAIQGAGMSFTGTSLPTLMSKEAQGSQGTAMGLRSASQSAGQIFGPLLGGEVYGFNHGYPYIIGATLMMVAFVIGWLAFEVLNRPRPAVGTLPR